MRKICTRRCKIYVYVRKARKAQIITLARDKWTPNTNFKPTPHLVLWKPRVTKFVAKKFIETCYQRKALLDFMWSGARSACRHIWLQVAGQVTIVSVFSFGPNICLTALKFGRNIVWQTFSFCLWWFVRAFAVHDNIAQHCFTSRICLSMFLKSLKNILCLWQAKNVCQTYICMVAKLTNIGSDKQTF